ncbi:VOC family protein [Variovorax guangxiensis]|uniref:VOC family protein n=1 Tax=Variovorax guangxiensis TaxID=1775474 RepID=UPI002865EC28|nr:VOC family protein [Variovorax guangxiensis]MDR6858683.1 2,3-dihydroxy-p-cumate/2,3-dihydroxybenzoate 3,4-dioxygenase [Variovorax guangxiensis]
MIRFNRLSRVDLHVTDLARSRSFYEQIVALQPVATGDDAVASFRCSDDFVSVRLLPGKSAGLRSAAWELQDAAQFEPLEQTLQASMTPYESISQGECASLRIERGLRARDPNNGVTLEFFTLAAPRQTYVFSPSTAKIMHLGHVVFATPKYQETVGYFEKVLNFARSDAVENSITFMRSFPNPFHHGIGIAHGDTPHFHHLNFMVSDIDDVGRLHTRLKKGQVPIVYGPGRHPISTSIFLYFLDPDGMTLEYSFGMETFPEEGAREPRLLPRVPEWSDSWGSVPEPRFGKGGVL